MVATMTNAPPDDNNDNDNGDGQANGGNYATAIACTSSLPVPSLVARHPSEFAVMGVGSAPSYSSSPSGRVPSSSSSTTMMATTRPSSPSGYDAAIYIRNTTDHAAETATLVERYRNFLVRHETSLCMFENFAERFEQYVLFRYDNGVLCELYYAAWNAVRHVNDVVLSGFGNGMGTTIGTRDEWLGVGSSDGIPRDYHATMDRIVLALRSLLTATMCVHPAVEAWSRRPTRPRRHRVAFPPSRTSSASGGDDDDYDDDDYDRREGGGEGAFLRAARASRTIERIRFVSRFALLSISWWAQRNRRRRGALRTTTTTTSDAGEDEVGDSGRRCGEDGVGVGDRSTTSRRRRTNATMPSFFPTLRGGGELDPHERVSSLRDAEDESRFVVYVGRRTGRRSIAGGRVRVAPPPLASSIGMRPYTSVVVDECMALAKWLSGPTIASEGGILYLHAVGELLHILRPLYWSAANDTWRRSNASYASSSYSSAKSSNRRVLLGVGPSHSFSIWKAWLLSFFMDFMSDVLLRIGNIEDQSSHDHSRSRRLVGHSPGGGNRMPRPLTSIDRAKLEQLDYRRHRHRLYLLRSPFYDTITRPVAVFLAGIMSSIPSFGLGRWASGYVLDMMDYWNSNHFMLES